MKQTPTPAPPKLPSWLPNYLRDELPSFDLWLLRCCAVAWGIGMVAVGYGYGWGYITARAASSGAAGMMATNLILRGQR